MYSIELRFKDHKTRVKVTRLITRVLLCSTIGLFLVWACGKLSTGIFPQVARFSESSKLFRGSDSQHVLSVHLVQEAKTMSSDILFLAEPTTNTVELTPLVDSKYYFVPLEYRSEDVTDIGTHKAAIRSVRDLFFFVQEQYKREEPLKIQHLNNKRRIKPVERCHSSFTRQNDCNSQYVEAEVNFKKKAENNHDQGNQDKKDHNVQVSKDYSLEKAFLGALSLLVFDSPVVVIAINLYDSFFDMS